MSGAAMSEHLRKFCSEDFNPERYVKEISQVCVGGPELLRHKTKIQSYAEETSQQLKKNVYKNYMQFIETAREISHLEGEMYQLSHLLSEQRVLLASMSPLPPPLEVAESNGIENMRLEQLESIEAIIESCPDLKSAANRILVHDGDLVELDILESTALHRCHAYLFSDILILATWISNRQGPAKYRYETTYDLGSLAVVNVKSLGHVQNAFKLLVFPDARLFQCPTLDTREEWLRKFDQAKKARAEAEQQGTKDDEAVKQAKPSPMRMDSVDSLGSNPFWSREDDRLLSSLSIDSQQVDPDTEWAFESPDDLEVLIAQRHFEEAYSLIEKTKAYLNDHPMPDISARVESQTQNLINVLMSELAVDGDKSLQGGLRATRRSVRLLNHLGKSSQACELYLKFCSNVLKAQTKRVKREGSTSAYVKRISQVFFSGLSGITAEFQFRAFPDSPSCSSAFVVWVSMEVSSFMTHFVKQVFVPQTSLTVLAESVKILKTAAAGHMPDLGLNLDYQMNGHLVGPVTKALFETKEKLIEAVRLRCSEDLWRPGGIKVTPSRNVAVSSSAGAQLIEPTEGSLQDLTANTIAFVKLYSSLLDDCLMIGWPDLEHAVGQVIYDVFDAQLKHLSVSKESNKYQSERPIILKNARYLLIDFLAHCKKKYAAVMLHNSRAFDKVVRNHALLLKDTSGMSSVIGYV